MCTSGPADINRPSLSSSKGLLKYPEASLSELNWEDVLPDIKMEQGATEQHTLTDTGSAPLITDDHSTATEGESGDDEERTAGALIVSPSHNSISILHCIALYSPHHGWRPADHCRQRGEFLSGVVPALLTRRKEAQNALPNRSAGPPATLDRPLCLRCIYHYQSGMVEKPCDCNINESNQSEARCWRLLTVEGAPSPLP